MAVLWFWHELPASSQRVSEEMRERLNASAERNFRSLNQEALARIQFSFELEDALRAKTWKN